MGSSRHSHDRAPYLRLVGPVDHDPRQALAEFLTDRLTEDLAAFWARDAARSDSASFPGMASQVAVLEDLRGTFRDGRLPSRRELRVLLHGYGRQRDYDPSRATLQLA